MFFTSFQKNKFSIYLYISSPPPFRRESSQWYKRNEEAWSQLGEEWGQANAGNLFPLLPSLLAQATSPFLMPGQVPAEKEENEGKKPIDFGN